MTLILSVVGSWLAVVGREAPSVQAPEKLQGPSSKVIQMRSLKRFSIKYSFAICRLPVGDTAGYQPALQGGAASSGRVGRVAVAGLATQARSRLRYASTRQTDVPKAGVFRSEPVRLGQAESHLVAPGRTKNPSGSHRIKVDQSGAGCVEIRMTCAENLSEFK